MTEIPNFSIENTLTCDVKSVVRLNKIFLKRKMFFDKQIKKKLTELSVQNQDNSETKYVGVLSQMFQWQILKCNNLLKKQANR